MSDFDGDTGKLPVEIQNSLDRAIICMWLEGFGVPVEADRSDETGRRIGLRFPDGWRYVTVGIV